MANLWDHPSTIAAEALTHMEDALVIAPLCAKDKTSDFTNRANGWKVGETVNFRTHGEYDVNEFAPGGAAQIVTQEIRTSTRPMTIEKHYDVSVELTAREEAMDLDSFSDQVIKPAAYKLAEYVDTYIGTKIIDAQGLFVPTTAVAFTASAAQLAQARKTAILQQLSKTGRFCLVDLDSEANLLGQEWFNQAQTRGDRGTATLTSGDMGRVMGMDFSASTAFPTTSMTGGTYANAILTENNSGANNKIGVSTLTVDTMGAGALAVGDRLAIAGVKRPLVVGTAIADTTSATTVALAHPITEVIPDNAAVTVVGESDTFTISGAIFDDKSLAIAFPMLDLPQDRVAGVMSNNGISIRVVKGYDLTKKMTTMSLDLLVGGFALDTRRITLCADATAIA